MEMRMKHWIKMWVEALYDPKLAQLDDHLWRIAVSCFLMAGEVDQHGLLPSLPDMAWKLRMAEDELENDIAMLSELIHHTDGMYIVVNYKKRQAKYAEKYINKDKDIPFTPANKPDVIDMNKDYYQQEALELYTLVTGQTQPPLDKLEQVVHNLRLVLDHYGSIEDAQEAGEKNYRKWCQTKGKTGRNYSPLNPAWIEKWIEAIEFKRVEQEVSA
jgi:hypothetical protein